MTHIIMPTLYLSTTGLRDKQKINYKRKGKNVRECMYSINLNCCSAGSSRFGSNKVEGKVSAPVGFIRSMFTVWCCCEGEMWDAEHRRAEQCSWFIMRNCDPFHGAEYWADWLTSNSLARCRRLTAPNRKGGVGERVCVAHSRISIILA